MKKYILAAVTLAAFTGMSFAQTPAAAPAAAPAKTEKPAPKKEAKKAAVKPEITTGEISAIDAAKNEITVKDAKGVEKAFTLEAAKMAGLTQGQKVKVTVKDGKVSVKEIKEHKKAEGKKAEAKKPEAAKTEAAK
jgi:hypothetical protein